MATPTVDELPIAPSQDRTSTFNAEMFAFLQAMGLLPGQINALVPFLAAAAGRSAISAVYTFSSATSGDPGAGAFRLNHSTQGSSTGAGLDLLDANGVDVSGVVARMGTGTSDIKGDLLVTLVGDPTVQLSAEVTDGTSPTGYRSLTLQNVVVSSANPFTAGDQVLVTYVRTGGKGDTGATAPAGVVALVQEQKAAGVSPDTPKVSLSENKRAYNTVVYDGIGISLSSNQVTLPAGTHLVVASAPCRGVNNTKMRLRNATDDTTLGMGSAAQATDLGSNIFMPVRLWAWAHFTIASPKAVVILPRFSGHPC